VLTQQLFPSIFVDWVIFRTASESDGQRFKLPLQIDYSICAILAYRTVTLVQNGILPVSPLIIEYCGESKVLLDFN